MPEISLILLGDCMLGRLLNNVIGEKRRGYIWGNMLPLMRRANAVVANLETTVSDSGRPFPGRVFHFQLSPHLAERALRVPNADSPPILTHCSLANNHLLDFGPNGLLETLAVLDSLKVSHCGSGATKQAAMAPRFIQVGEFTIGFLSASDHPAEYRATSERPGVWFVESESVGHETWDEMISAAKQAKERCDFLVFSIHWGPNYVDRIAKEHQILAHRLIDAGVDIIHGHSAHHVLPIEKYKGGIIFYSMADFVDDYAVDAHYRNDLGFAAELRLLKNEGGGLGGVEIKRIYPTRIINFHVEKLPADTTEYKRVMDVLCSQPVFTENH